MAMDIGAEEEGEQWAPTTEWAVKSSEATTRYEGDDKGRGEGTTTDSAFCPGSKLAFVPVPVLEPGHGFRDKSLEAFVPDARTGTKCPWR